MDPAAATPALPAPAPYVAPFLIGTVVSAIFFGVLSLQAFVFVQTPSPGLAPGRARARLVVVLIWLLNALNLFSAAWSSYLFMVTYFGNLERLFTAAIPWSVVSIIVCGALSNCLVQSWFAWSIWTHYGRHPVTGLVLVSAALSRPTQPAHQRAQLAVAPQEASTRARTAPPRPPVRWPPERNLHRRRAAA
ncbi:hypothetical protein PsYK624_054840 [Phanerochaete sordida]|uniref:Uncharacterized protein n=1 Tax=Phanerochaete sordida TaxID=48140 RepID=A0A9P3G7R6_9APHY|nr:hypothetical protein PsYK624_054840 [Phanerochaete sordida]